MKIGIIGAMDIEVDGIKKQIENCRTETLGVTDFYYGRIGDCDVVVAKSGEGKVNAAMTAQTMILRYNPDIIINTGVAGALKSGMKLMDVVVADDVCQHDFDISPLGYEPGFVPRAECVKIMCDKDAADILEKCAKAVLKSSVYRGTVASGDIFVASDEQRDRIKRVFGAVSAEMEGGSIGQVCLLNGTRFCVLRVMSDNADDGADISFSEFAAKAADISVNITLNFIKSF